MQCDHVFGILTRGPFPTGDPSDSQVEAHLSICADCRRLARALRPLESPARETIPPDESHGLPVYRGTACTAADERLTTLVDEAILHLDEPAAASTSPAEVPVPAASVSEAPAAEVRRGVNWGWRFLAGFLLGAVVSAAIQALMAP